MSSDRTVLPELRLELRGITKEYPGVRANDDVSLRVRPGQIHALLGENGAGKSTLMKIVYGAVQPDAGQILWNGEPVIVKSPQAARDLGIAMVFQHFSLFETLTAAENVWLGLEKGWTLPKVAERVREVSHQYGLEIDPMRPVHTLTVGERQRVEIVRALLSNPKLLILDEPTSVLTPPAVQKLFVTLRKLAAEGCSILYISHKLDEIRALCHHSTVLRGGKVTGEVVPSLETNASLSRLMIGAEPPELRHLERAPGEAALEVHALSLPKRDPFATALVDVSFKVRAGEILGVAGVSGNGQKELVAALSGEDLGAGKGSLRLFGADIARASPVKRRELGLHFVPEERLGRATVPNLSLAENTLLTRREAVSRRGWLDRRVLAQLTRHLIAGFKVKANGPSSKAKSLSGGNLQKFVVGREIDARPKVLIVSQPTWGVDVGASAQIRGELLRLRDEGCAVLVVSEELEELFEVSDALVVIANGRVSPRLPTSEATIERIGEWMSGLWPEAESARGVTAGAIGSEALHASA
jgi:simple sugar transport system ATP-binding protein